jgi:small subunit ribosomal protein S11
MTDTATQETKETNPKASSDAPMASRESKSRPKRPGKKSKKSVPFGRVHVLATFNNTIISITDEKGGLLAQSSAGSCGFRGSKKGTAYAAQVASLKAIDTAKTNHGLSKAEVFVRGVGLGRDAAIRALSSSDIKLELISDVTGIPHGGCRPKKARRV